MIASDWLLSDVSTKSKREHEARQAQSQETTAVSQQSLGLQQAMPCMNGRLE